MDILTLNKIAACGTDLFGDAYTVSDTAENPVGILVRSASMHDMPLPESLLAVARAGAGVNNIPLDVCSEAGVVVFNTPGANANAVKELVITGLLLASRKVVPAIEWATTLKGKGAEVAKLVEKGKGQFAGPEILGKKLGVIGLGAIGVLVANAAKSLGMEVYGYDPYLSVDAAWALSRSIHHAATLEQIYAECDYITLHLPLNDGTRGMIGTDALAQMKDGVRVLNFARGELVDSDAMKAALANGKVAAYVVDFPSDEMLCVDNVTAIPHLGASTPESEDNCAVMAVQELKAYLEQGVIRNSVNFPAMELEKSSAVRVCVLHRNVPTLLAQISTVISEAGVNIETLTNRSRKDIAYTVADISDDITQAVMDKVAAIDGVIRVRKV